MAEPAWAGRPASHGCLGRTGHRRQEHRLSGVSRRLARSAWRSRCGLGCRRGAALSDSGSKFGGLSNRRPWWCRRRCPGRRDANGLGVIGAGEMAWTQAWAVCHVDSGLGRLSRPAFRGSTHLQSNQGMCRGFGCAHLNICGRRRRDLRIRESRRRRGRRGASLNYFHLTHRIRRMAKAGVPREFNRAEVGRQSELDPSIARVASVVASDSPDQCNSMPASWFTSEQMSPLGGVLCGDIPGRMSDRDITLYCSAGLARSEPVLAAELLAHMDGPPVVDTQSFAG